LPDFERPDVPETPEFLDELEGRLRMSARRPPARPLRLQLRRPDWIGMQRYLMPVGMSAMAFVVAAAFLSPGYQDPMVRRSSPTATSVPAAAVAFAEPGSPSVGPSESLLIDGRYSPAELAASAAAGGTSEAVRSSIR
jgi:hypothetical protein